MERFTNAELEQAQKTLASTIRKNEKAYATLSQKTPPRLGQMMLVARNLQNLRVYLALVEDARTGTHTEWAAEDLETALAAIPGDTARIEAVLPKFRPGTSQHTLAVRRIATYEMAAALAQAARDHLRA